MRLSWVTRSVVIPRDALIRFKGSARRIRTSLRYPTPSFRSGSERAAPLGESGGAGLLLGVAVLEVAPRRKVVVGLGMNRRELLQRSHAPEPQYRPLSWLECQVRVIASVVEPASHLAVITVAKVLVEQHLGIEACR
jgi:hypothetical protein